LGIACCFEALPDVFVLEQNVPAIAESAWNVAEAVATQQMLRHCPQTPLLVPPKPWTWSRNDDGLDFLKGCRDQEAVQRAIVSGTLRPHMDAINYLQSTAFKIDPDVLSLVRNHSLWLNPPLLGVSRTHRKDRGPRQVLEWDIKEAEILASEPFYVQLRCEWRGRMLPISDLHYARDDYLRAMFRFAQGAPIGERGIYWLKVSTANCFGGAIARAPFDERVKWVDEKMDTLRRLVADPPSGLKFVKNSLSVERSLSGSGQRILISFIPTQMSWWTATTTPISSRRFRSTRAIAVHNTIAF